MDAETTLVLAGFKPAQLSQPIPQEKVYKAFSWALAKSHCVRHGITDDEEANRVLQQVTEKVHRYCVCPKYIKQRYGTLSIRPEEEYPDRLKKNGAYLRFPSEEALFKDLRDKDTHPDGLSLKERMELFDRIVSDCFDKLYQDEMDAPDDLIHVTCSGYTSPSPAERLISKKDWQTTVTHCYHMGCYAFFPGLRMAAGAHAAATCGLTAPKTRVDVAHTEVLSLHLKLSSLAPEDIITQTLFSDGFIKYSVIPESVARRQGGKGMRLLTFKECLIPNSLADMTWLIGNHQFDMTLAIEVPIQIERSIRPFLNDLFGQIDKDFSAEKESLYFAIHPGGPKIVDFVCSELNLRPDQVKYSHQILYEYGNMSSATVPYLLDAVLKDDSIPDGTLVPAFAFGPGLTIAGAVFEKVNLQTSR